MTDTSLDLPDDDPCVFYLSGGRPFTILYRTSLTAVLITRDQQGIGHLLVIPTRHYPTLLEATAEERHARIDDAYERPGIAVWQNNGTAAHQAIAHLHFHVAGTLPGGGTDFGEVPDLTVDKQTKSRQLAEATTSPICQPWQNAPREPASGHPTGTLKSADVFGHSVQSTFETDSSNGFRERWVVSTMCLTRAILSKRE